ncbi:MAG TPA: hypothetical protein VLM89_06855 [Phycisphaerae bacterium]|nr:hypothetical protein [Phycisphaerae bacterium]
MHPDDAQPDDEERPHQPQEQADASSERRWPAVFAFVTAWLYPATSARRMRHVTLGSAWLIHLAAGLLTFILFVAMAGLSQSDRNPFGLFAEILKEFTGPRPQEALLVTGAIVLSIEIAYLILAGLVMPWGAVDEPLWSSWKNGLRFSWLHTTHALPVVLLVGDLSVWHSWAEREYYQATPPPGWTTTAPSFPTRPSGPAATSQAWRDYQAEVQEHIKKQQEAAVQSQRAWQARTHNKPLFLKFGPALICLIGIGCAFWIVGAVLRAAGVRRPAPAINRPPTCEFCGYNLIGTAAESRCPECGRAVVESLGADVRPGTAWDRRHSIGPLKAWWRCGFDAVFRPQRLGRQLKVSAQVHDHRLFMAAHLPVIFVLGGLGAMFCALILWKSDNVIAHFTEFLLLLPALIGGMAAMTILAVVGLAAGLVGLVYSLRNGRNLMPATIQMGCYLGGYLTVWTAFGAALAVAAFWAEQANLIEAWARRQRADESFLLFLMWLLPNVLFLGGFFVLVRRGTAGAQHANR